MTDIVMISKVEKDDNGELLITIPQDVINDLGLSDGDLMEWDDKTTPSGEPYALIWKKVPKGDK